MSVDGGSIIVNRQGCSVVGIHSAIGVVFLMLQITFRNFRIFGGLHLEVQSSEPLGILGITPIKRLQVPVVQKLDSAIHRINSYP